jgi:hypothetical protein
LALVDRQIEDKFYNMASYQSSFCQLNNSLSCIQPKSVVRYFDGTYRHLSPVFYDPDFANISRVLYEASRHPATAAEFLFFAGKGYRVTETEAWSDVTRTSVPIGWPLEKNVSEAAESQHLDEIDMFLQSEVKPLLETAMKDLEHDLQVTEIVSCPTCGLHQQTIKNIHRMKLLAESKIFISETRIQNH